MFKNLGKIALFSDGELIDIFNDYVDAYKFGLHSYGEGNFSIKEIGEKAQNLGIISLFIKPKTAEDFQDN